MIGVDVVKIQRIEKIAGSERIFTKEEIEYAEKFKNKLEHYAGFFACKEALYKALDNKKQTEVKFNEISVCHRDNAAPFFEFLGQTKQVIGEDEFNLSISHDGEYAIAFVTKKI